MSRLQLPRRRALVAGALVGLGGLGGLATTRSEPAPGPVDGTWPMGRGDPANTGVAADPGPDGPASARWTFEEHLVAGKAPVVADGRLYVGTADDRPAMVALDAATGSEAWRAAFDRQVGFPDAAGAVVDDMVVAAFDRLLVGLDATSGDVRWRLRPGDGVTAPVADDGTVYLAVSGHGTVIAVDAATGAVAWERSVGEYLPAPVAVAGGTVFAVAGDEESGSLVALEGASGEQRWRRGLDSQPTARPVVGDGRVFLVQEGALRAVSTTGEPRFTVTIPTAEEAGLHLSRGGSAPAVDDGTVYIGAPDGHVYAVDAATGQREWAFRTWNGVSGDPVVAGDTVYVASDDTFVYALDADDGSRRWEYDTTGTPRGGGAAVVAGVLFVATDENRLYALDGP